MIPRLLLSMLTSFLLTEAVECGAAYILGLRSRDVLRLMFTRILTMLRLLVDLVRSDGTVCF